MSCAVHLILPTACTAAKLNARLLIRPKAIVSAMDICPFVVHGMASCHSIHSSTIVLVDVNDSNSADQDKSLVDRPVLKLATNSSSFNPFTVHMSLG